jgi:hypothetical protein
MSSSSTPPSSLRSQSLLGSLHEGGTEFPNNCTNIENAERKHEMQAYVVQRFIFRLSASTEQFEIDDA